MADETVEQRVIRVFAKFKKVEPDTITPETTFEELELDSLDGLNLIFELEEEFDLMIPDDKVREMKSVKEAVEGIEFLIANPVDTQAEIEKALKARAGDRAAKPAPAPEPTKEEEAPAKKEEDEDAA